MPPKTERRELGRSIKDNIIGMSIAGASVRKIADELGLASSTVHFVIKRYKDSGSTENKTRSGRPKKLTERDCRHILRNLKKDRRAILQDITNEIPLNVSSSTIRHMLHT